MSQPRYWHLDALDWEDPQQVRSEVRALARTGAAAGARRAPLSRGENGFFAALNEMPPGLVVLSGSCTVADGTRLSAGDVASIPARLEYGFEVGPEGLRFVVVRASDARTTLSD